MDFICLVIGLTIGVFLGVIVMHIRTHRWRRKIVAGTFHIDFSDPMKDVCNLELDTNLNDIYMMKQMILNIKTHE